MLKHLHDPIPALATAGVPASLEALVTACLQKKQTDRPRSMDDIAAALKRVRQELTGQAMSSPSLTMPDDLRALLREEPGESPPITLMPKEGSSPSHVAPAPVPAYAVEPQPSPSSSYTPSSLAVLANSGEWRIGAAPPPLENSIRPIHGNGPGSRRHARRASWAVAAGVLIGLGVAGVGVAFRLGHLDAFIAMISPPQQPVPVTSTVKATAAASARLRIKTTPPGADVFDVTSGVPRLLGITPLVVPWEIAVGDGSRALLLKLPGRVPARAMVDPPPPSSTNEPVWLDVEASLRAAPARP
jgi:hypothetical protein